MTSSTQHELGNSSTDLFDRMGERIRQFICGLHGHDAQLHFERERLSLVCTSCNYESPGWDVRRAPHAHHTTAATAARMPLVGKHRIA
jgi:hypothetical protein